MEEACKIIGHYNLKDACSAVVATEVHRAAYSILGTDDPYKDMKDRCNQTALALLPKAERVIECSDDRLKAAMLCSIIGNIMDFGIASSPDKPEGLIQEFDTLFSEGLGVDDSDKVKTYMEKGAKVLFFSDNCGEIVFDKLLCKEIKRLGSHLTFVVRGEPILTDATLEDIYEFGIDKVADKVLTTGCFAVGVDFDHLSEELLRALQGADLIIAKGMANYETFSEVKYRPIAYLLRTKCEPVAGDMGLKTNISVVKIYE
jgi:hypothetical protein